MIHSNDYILSQPLLDNSTRLSVKLSVEAVKSIILHMSASNTSEPVNTLTLSFRTAADFMSTVLRNPNRFKSGQPLLEVNLSVLINGIEHSDYIVDQLNIVWNENSNGTASFNLKKIRPFTSFPVLTADSEVKVGSTISIKSTIVLGPDSWVHTIFTGKISSFNYDMWTDKTSVQCLDNSFDISRLSSKISQEFLESGKFFTELISLEWHTFVTQIQATLYVYKLSKDIDLNQNVQLLGVWQTSDKTLSTNLLEGQGSKAYRFSKSTIDNSSRLIFYSDEVNGTLAQALLAGFTNFQIRYSVTSKEETIFGSTPVKKSVLLKKVAQISGIEDIVIKRENYPEDEIVKVSVTANNEYPLDFINKLIVPQTWRAYFNEGGSLIIDREVLSKSPKLLYTDDDIYENTLKVTQDLTRVVNVQDVGGAVLVEPPGTGGTNDPSVPTSTTPTSITPSPANKTSLVVRKVLLKTVSLPSTSSYTFDGGNPSTTDLANLIAYYFDELNLNDYEDKLLGGKVFPGDLFFYTNYGGVISPPQPGTNFRTTMWGLYNLFGKLSHTSIILAPVALRSVGVKESVNGGYMGIDIILGRDSTEQSQNNITIPGFPAGAKVGSEGQYTVSGNNNTIGIAISYIHPFVTPNVYSPSDPVVVSAETAQLQIWANVKLTS